MILPLNHLSPINLECWASWPLPPTSTEVTDESMGPPPVSSLPMMTRRRLSPLGRVAFQVIEEISARDHATPLIFSSRHGDVASTLKLLTAMAEKIDVSPTGFSMSVHNAFAGLLSILSGNPHAHTAIAAGPDSFSIGLVELIAQLTAQPELPVTLVYYDETLPEVYRSFDDGQTETIAFAGRFQSSALNASKGSLTLYPREHCDPADHNRTTEPECRSFIQALTQTPSVFFSRCAGLAWDIRVDDRTC